MTGFKVGSTLLAVTFACAMSGAAQAPAGDSLATRSMWALYVGYGEGAQFVAGAQLHLRTPAQPLAFVFTPKGGLLLDTRSVRMMLEYQGVDWLQQYRLLAGLRWSL